MILFCLGACRKDFTNLNIDPKRPRDVPPSGLFTYAQRRLSNTITSSSVNLNIFRLIEQYWQETEYTDESNYDITTRPIPDNIWNALYTDVLKNFEEAKKKIPTQVANVTVQKNQIAITDIMQVYTWYYLLTTYGNIPYSEALNIDKPFPKYDDAKTVYNDLLTRLDADIAALDPAAGSLGNADIIYNGNVNSWKKFANTFKLKMGMLLADIDNTKAQSIVESAMSAGVFTSNADNATFKYQVSPPNTNPVWVDLVQVGRDDFVAASTLVDNMNTLNDPRRPLYFRINKAGTFTGGKPGEKSNNGSFSYPAVKLTQPEYPALLLSYDETEFFLAEAVERGYNVGGPAEIHYDNAIIASINYWGGSAADATAYLANQAVAYSKASGTYKGKIGNQKWIALYNRGWDAWIDTRRLDFPKLTAPSTAVSAFPVRLKYPIKEQNVNGVNYSQAAAAIGGDLVITKLFWDKF